MSMTIVENAQYLMEMELIGWSDPKSSPVVPKPEINKSKYPY